MTMTTLVAIWLGSALLMGVLGVMAGAMDRSEKAASALVFVVLAVVGPFVVLVLLGALAVQTARGRGPIRLFARRDDEKKVPLERDTVLCDLILLRRRYDPELRRRPRPNCWPAFALALTPEAELASTVETLVWRRDAASAFEFGSNRIDTVRDALWAIDDREIERLVDAALKSLPQGYAAYAELDRDLHVKCVRYAFAWALKSIQHGREASAYPPQIWWGQRMSLAEASEQYCGDGEGSSLKADGQVDVTRTGQQFRALMNRAGPGDELYSFCSPPETWSHLGGRDGMVLVRRGRPAAHVNLAMN